MRVSLAPALELIATSALLDSTPVRPNGTRIWTEEQLTL
jgi:hypothetical protein